MKVLCLHNNFRGGHDSFKTFYSVLIDSMEKLGIEVYSANNVDEARNILASFCIDFSINIGKYNYFVEETPLYDFAKTVNYQWVIDNPMKYNLDTESRYNRLIFIDEEFMLMPKMNRADYLFLPHLVPPHRQTMNMRRDIIFAPLKIKNMREIGKQIEASAEKNNIQDFINSYDMSTSFVRAYMEYTNSHHIKNEEEFFRLTNSYTRSKKRIDILNSIKRHEVYITSDSKIEELDGDNIHYVKFANFEDTIGLIRMAKYVLNVNPNYNRCLHERISYSVAVGAVSITDSNSLLDELDFPLRVPINSADSIDDLIDNLDNNIDYNSLQYDAISGYSACESLNIIINNYRENM